MLRPRFHSAGLKLLSPRRSQVTVSAALEIEIDNPRKACPLASLRREGAKKGGQRLGVEGTRKLTIPCDLPAPGRYVVQLFTSNERFGRYGYAGKILVNRSR